MLRETRQKTAYNLYYFYEKDKIYKMGRALALTINNGRTLEAGSGSGGVAQWLTNTPVARRRHAKNFLPPKGV